MLQVKLVTPIYYVTKFQGIFISQKMTLWPDDKQDPLTCVAIAAGNKGQFSKKLSLPNFAQLRMGKLAE